MVTVRWGIAPVACADWHSLSINNIVTPAVLVEVCTLLSVILVFSLFSLILCFWFHVVVLRCMMSVFVCMLNIMYRILWWFYLSSFFSVNWECVVNCVCVYVCAQLMTWMTSAVSLLCLAMHRHSWNKLSTVHQRTRAASDTVTLWGRGGLPCGVTAAVKWFNAAMGQSFLQCNVCKVVKHYVCALSLSQSVKMYLDVSVEMYVAVSGYVLYCNINFFSDPHSMYTPFNVHFSR